MLVEMGQHQRAEAVARSITYPIYQAVVLARIAETLARAGKVGSALRVAPATWAVGHWMTAARPVLLLMPSAFTALARTIEE
jgi:hypothetical protein